jgi:hypothetical protein
MKKIKFLSFLSIFILAACGKEVTTSSEIINYEVDKTYELNKNVIDDSNFKTLSFNQNNKVYGTDTGSYEKYDNTYVEGYRITGGALTDFVCLLKTPSYETLSNPLNSSLSNSVSYDGIYEFDIIYKSETGFSLYYSNSRLFSDPCVFKGTNGDYVNLKIRIDHSSFFRIESSLSDVYIKTLLIKYNPSIKKADSSYLNYQNYRLNIEYTDFSNLKDGDKRRIPSSVTYTSSGEYKINSYKEYTYHTFDYIENNPTKAKDIALVNPVDVASYYMLFRAFPLNYVYKAEVSEMSQYFGDKTRAISHYDGTYGYAKSIPYFIPEDKNKPSYYELDFDTNGTYYGGSRGTGRVVIFEYGLTNEEYKGVPVCLYTDDHYATFAEFMNDGTFGTKFDAEKNRTFYKYSIPKTL